MTYDPTLVDVELAEYPLQSAVSRLMPSRFRALAEEKIDCYHVALRSTVFTGDGDISALSQTPFVPGVLGLTLSQHCTNYGNLGKQSVILMLE